MHFLYNFHEIKNKLKKNQKNKQTNKQTKNEIGLKKNLTG